MIKTTCEKNRWSGRKGKNVVQ
jgi:predicted RNase H-like HicB family nuclease/predicted RNA binding protein YcfA (HicA-like mRNA interferase family)